MKYPHAAEGRSEHDCFTARRGVDVAVLTTGPLAYQIKHTANSIQRRSNYPALWQVSSTPVKQMIRARSVLPGLPKGTSTGRWRRGWSNSLSKQEPRRYSPARASMPHRKGRGLPHTRTVLPSLSERAAWSQGQTCSSRFTTTGTTTDPQAPRCTCVEQQPSPGICLLGLV